MVTTQAYHGMDSYNPQTSNVRYNLLPHDNSTLYRKFNRTLGIDTRKAPAQNLDNWMNNISVDFKPELQDAVFYYSPRTQASERLKLCISTKEMDEATWRYAHHGQVVLDGTFGVCSSRMLLFIALAIDEEGKGVPIAFFLFSAPTGTRATHAGYNTAILQELLQQWKDHLGTHNGSKFEPFVGITDTDTKERGALLGVWPLISLLLCKFHIRQCWTNKRKALLRAAGGSKFWKDHVLERSRSLEVRCV